MVNVYTEKQNALAQEYYAAGIRAMDGQHASDAAIDFETALVYSHDNFQYRLKLTDALLASGATSEAMAQLRAFRDQRPGDSQVNLELARLEAKRGHTDEALRYYQDAVEGVGPERVDTVAFRAGVSLESADYLVQLGRREQAEAALRAIAAVLPSNSPEQVKLASLFLRNGDPGRAMNAYQARLNVARHDATAILGAAQANFAIANYPGARHYLGELNQKTAESQELLAKLDRMEALDPFAKNATERVQTERTMAAFRIALERLSGCGVPFAQSMTGIPMSAPSTAGPAAKDPAQWSGFAKWAEQLSPLMTERKMRGRDDVIESTMRFTFQAEMAAQKDCGKPTLNDEAILLLARERLGASQ
jgi:tetratricopeptide (TPR) repeat protein